MIGIFLSLDSRIRVALKKVWTLTNVDGISKPEPEQEAPQGEIIEIFCYGYGFDKVTRQM